MKIAALLVLATACATTQEHALPPTRVALRLEKIDGSALTLGALRGRVVVLTVISTWADPALLEVPRLKAIHAAERAEDLAIVAVVLEEKKIARIFAETFEIPYEVVVSDDPAALTSEHGPLGSITIVPTTFLIDREGYVVARMDGIWEEGVLEAAVDRLVASDRGGP